MTTTKQRERCDQNSMIEFRHRIKKNKICEDILHSGLSTYANASLVSTLQQQVYCLFVRYIIFFNLYTVQIQILLKFLEDDSYGY